jgi:hypothetical protein
MRRIESLLFLTLWLGYGALINSENLVKFGLQQAGVEAYGERHHFYLEGSTVPALHVQPVIDAFVSDGHIYPAKQPGQFMIGALVYFLLHALGLSYSNNFLLTAALVTFMTASLVTAASVVAVFRMARAILGDATAFFWPLLAALSFGLGSTMTAYSGLAWHDTLATGYLAIAFYLSARALRGENDWSGVVGDRAVQTAERFVVTSFQQRLSDDRRRSFIAAAGAGLFLGLTVTTSMLAFLPAAVLTLFFIASRRWNLLPAFVTGALAGLAPLLIYNAVCFGNPFLMPNFAGNYRETFFHFNLANFSAKLAFYGRMLTAYVPIFWLGLVGLVLYPRSRRRYQATLGAMLATLAAYILNIDANGTCQYGPRYLLPAMPIMALGLIGFSFLKNALARQIAAWVVSICLVACVFINLLGAAHGAMLCDYPQVAVARYLWEMRNGPPPIFPLASIVAIPLVVCCAMLVNTLLRVPKAGGGQ